MRIFLSHSSRDKATVREVRAYLPSWISSWIDEDELMVGSSLAPALKRAINEEVDYVVLFLGTEALDSSWVRREIQWALEREEELGRIFLLPVLLVDVRDGLDELGLSDRLTLELVDFTRIGMNTLAEKLTNHLGSWLSEMLRVSKAQVPRASKISGLSDVDNSVVAALRAVPAEWRGQVDSILTRPFLHDLMSSQIGQIPLTPAQYYQRILAEMGRAESGWEVFAVSTLTSMLWREDLDQTRYEARNFAAVQRGAAIRRVFVVGEGADADFQPTLTRQLDCGIQVRIAGYGLFAHMAELEDFVLFVAPEGSQAFVAHPTIDGSRRIRSGMLEVSANGTSRLRGLFDEVWELALPTEGLLDEQIADQERRAASAPTPGQDMVVRRLHRPVTTCEEAAAERGIPLANELKSLILRSQDGYLAVHLPGDGVLSLRKVKDRLEVADAYLADPEDLLSLRMSPGTVSAVFDPVWSMPHLISRRVLDLREVMTNNGTRTGYVAFDPSLLLQAKSVVVGDFEK